MNFLFLLKFSPLILALFFTTIAWIEASPKNEEDSFHGVDLEAVERMPLAGRIQFAKEFFEGQSKNTKEGEIKNSTKDKCYPDAKFNRCCYQIDFSCPFGVDPDQLREDACQYPPKSLTSFQGICIGYYITKYMKCYTDNRNNRDCCYKAGVPKDCTYLIWSADCGDFCDGTPKHYDALTGYHCCEDYVNKIATCNKHHVDLSADTVAVTDKEPFCQRGCTPPWPVYCKQSKELDGALLKKAAK